MKKTIFITLLLFVVCSCNIDEEYYVDPPKIILDNASGVYSTKIGKTITISPRYENAENATFSWIIDGVVVSRNSSFQFQGETIGETFVTIKVENEMGADQQEIRIDVVEEEIPNVSLAGAEKGFALAFGTTLTLKALVRKTSLPTTCAWLVDGEKVSNELSYTFSAKKIGTYTLRFEAQNADGVDYIETKIEVVEHAPISWTFEQTNYQTVAGRTIEIGPIETQNLENATFTFTLGEKILQQGKNQTWSCNLTNEGEYEIGITAQIVRGDKTETLTQTVNVNVIASSSLLYRAKKQNSVANWNKVYEYTPAPGQFINEQKTGGFDGSQTTPEKAIAYAEARLKVGTWVSLGGFGGYIVVGFDHSIDNGEGYDFAVVGNSFKGSSEPGIVWVMQDENADGQPNDNWYELRGSEANNYSTIYNYAVTYYRPRAPQMSVQWIDNQGVSGEIDYLETSHTQDYYYPFWIEADSYTLRGTCLPARNHDKSGNGSYWVQQEYSWGYADNFSPTDLLSSNSKTNRFDIANAIDASGNLVDLDFIDFVKVQTAVNAKSGWLGELSTEVADFFDLNMSQE